MTYPHRHAANNDGWSVRDAAVAHDVAVARRRGALIVLCAASFLATLDTTIVSIALISRPGWRPAFPTQRPRSAAASGWAVVPRSLLPLAQAA